VKKLWLFKGGHQKGKLKVEGRLLSAVFVGEDRGRTQWQKEASRAFAELSRPRPLEEGVGYGVGDKEGSGPCVVWVV